MGPSAEPGVGRPIRKLWATVAAVRPGREAPEPQWATAAVEVGRALGLGPPEPQWAAAVGPGSVCRAEQKI